MMRQVMESAGLENWPSLSLAIFFALFLLVLLWIFRSGSGDFYRRLGDLALEDGETVAGPKGKAQAKKEMQ